MADAKRGRLPQRTPPGGVGLPRRGAHEVTGDVQPRGHGGSHALLGARRVMEAAQLDQLGVLQALDANGKPRGSGTSKAL